MLSPEELLKVANAYAKATGVALTTVGRLSCRNDKIFVRIGEGGGALSRSIETATGWFQDNWPAAACWPADVPGKPAKRIKATTT